MAINPTAWSTQKIITYLTVCGDWIKSAKLDQYRWADRYYRAAESIALGQKTGADIYKFIDELWPAGLKANIVHYNGKPFNSVKLIPAEELGDCVIAPPLKNFKFDPAEAWPEEGDDDFSETETPKRKPTKRKSFEDMPESDEDSEGENIPKPFLDQFKPKKRRLN